MEELRPRKIYQIVQDVLMELPLPMKFDLTARSVKMVYMKQLPTALIATSVLTELKLKQIARIASSVLMELQKQILIILFVQSVLMERKHSKIDLTAVCVIMERQRPMLTVLFALNAQEITEKNLKMVVLLVKMVLVYLLLVLANFVLMVSKPRQIVLTVLNVQMVRPKLMLNKWIVQNVQMASLF
jgi:hypothetical protein